MSDAALRYAGPLTETVAPAKGKGLLARFYDAMIEARMRQAMRELELHRHLMPRNAGAEPTV
jgi:hypothetical protein